MRLLILAAALAAGSTMAETRVARNGDDHVKLIEAPCPYASVLRFIPEDRRAEFRKADARVNGERFFACWIVLDDQVGLIYEDGDRGLIPASAFKLDDQV
jgi:hypothetical protein